MLADREPSPINAAHQVGGPSRSDPPTAAFLLAYLGRCVRHVIFRDLVEAAGSTPPPAAMKRLLLLPEIEGIDPEDLILGEEGAGLDSLARISAAAAVSRFFDMGSTGMDDYLMFEPTVGGWARLVARHLEMQGAQAKLMFQTSGSTDKPSLVETRLSALTDEVAALRTTVLPENTRRIIGLAPPHHIYGMLFTVLLPAASGIPVVDATHRGPGAILSEIAAGDFIVGTPHNWQTLLSLGKPFPTGACGVTSGGPMSRELWEALSNCKLESLVEIFGSTETGGLGWRRSPTDPFTLFPHCQRERHLIRKVTEHAALKLQDRLQWIDMTRFRPVGRIDRAVQIAGVNVSLQKVRAVLLASPQVADAAVRPDAGRLKAFVVPADPHGPHEALEAHLVEHARAHLDAVARPVAYTFGSGLPRNEMGKLTDW